MLIEKREELRRSSRSNKPIQAESLLADKLEDTVITQETKEGK